jgi:hypothetical protein
MPLGRDISRAYYIRSDPALRRLEKCSRVFGGYQVEIYLELEISLKSTGRSA